MLKTLYPKFQEWSEKGSIYLFSDTHFDDQDCKLMDPNWITPEEQINRINKLVHKNDTLILLGDVGNKRWISKLKAGRRILICGNHDGGAQNYEHTIIYKPVKMADDSVSLMPFLERCFDEIYTGPLMIAEKIILSHEPIPNINWALNIHGHNHSGFKNDWYHFNVCSNTIDYTPINLKDIINSGRLNTIDSLHRLTIDDATEKANKRR